MLQESNRVRLVIDTNIWISYLIAKGIKGRMNEILLDSRFDICISLSLIEEFLRVASYPKLQKYISPELALDFAEGLQFDFIMIDVVSNAT